MFAKVNCGYCSPDYLNQNCVKDRFGDKTIKTMIWNYGWFKGIDDNAFSSFDQLETLQFSNYANLGNRLEKSEIFNGLSKLKNLIFSLNKIQTLPQNFFKNVQNLINLDLSQNYLNNIDGTTFNSLSNLESLTLNNNNLNSFPSYIFVPLIKLRSLDLGNNNLQNSYKEYFQNLTKLEFLNLGNNNIMINGYDDNSFPPSLTSQVNVIGNPSNPCSPMRLNLGCVQWLYISSTITEIDWSYGSNEAFTSINSNAFSTYKQLTKLTFSNHAKLGQSLLPFFDGLSELQELILSLCGINSLPKNLFTSLKKLINLDLSQNSIYTFDCDAFSGLPQLQVLDLNKVSLDYYTLPDNIFQSLYNGFKLKLHWNLFPDSFTVKKSLFKYQNITVIIQKYPDPVTNNYRDCIHRLGSYNNIYMNFDLTDNNYNYCCKKDWQPCCAFSGQECMTWEGNSALEQRKVKTATCCDGLTCNETTMKCNKT